jgi:hypothetical protein
LHLPSPAASEITVIKNRKWIVLHGQMNTKKGKETQTRKARRKEKKGKTKRTEHKGKEKKGKREER